MKTSIAVAKVNKYSVESGDVLEVMEGSRITIRFFNPHLA